MRSSRLAAPIAAVVAALVVLPAVAVSPHVAQAQTPVDCGGMRVEIDHGGVLPFVLPDSAGDTLQLEPDDVLAVRVVNAPESGRVELGLLLPFGTRIARSETWSGLNPGGVEEFEVDVSDFSGWVRGAFRADVKLFDGATPLCTVPIVVRLSGFGGLAGPVAAGATAASGIAVVAAGAWGAQGAGANVRVRIGLQRRRSTGWRRWAPAPAWKRTVLATLIGVVAGFVTTTLLQQAGEVQMESGVLVRGAVSGGGVSLGFSLIWASVITFLRSPVTPDFANLPAGDFPTSGWSSDTGAHPGEADLPGNTKPDDAPGP